MDKNVRIGKDGFAYWDGFDSDDFKEIESLHRPWQRFFLNRVKSKIDNMNLSQAKFCEKSNSIISQSSTLDTSYRILGNTFSQYTNVHSNNFRVAPVDCVIAISETLGVSVDYLLGIDSAETKEKTDIQDVTGLTSNSIDVLTSNTVIPDFLNFAFSSPLLEAICKQIKNMSLSEKWVNDFLSSYSGDLSLKIEDAINEYNSISFVFSRSEESFKKLLISKLPLKDMLPINDYLKANLSYDRYNQIKLQVRDNPTAPNIYNTFIEDTVMCVYEIANFKTNKDYYISELSHTFIELVKDFSKKRNGAD